MFRFEQLPKKAFERAFELLFWAEASVTQVVDAEGIHRTYSKIFLQSLLHRQQHCLNLGQFIFVRNPFRPNVLLIIQVVLVLLELACSDRLLAKHALELVSADRSAVVFVNVVANSFQVRSRLEIVLVDQIGDHVLNYNLTCCFVCQVIKNVDILHFSKQHLQRPDAFAHVPRNFVLLILELHLFEDTEADWIDEDQAAVNARCVDNKNLLVALLKT